MNLFSPVYLHQLSVYPKRQFQYKKFPFTSPIHMSGEFIITLSYVLGQFGIYFNILDANTLTSIYKHTLRKLI
jgi:uncharacterized protein YifE (UPF0438 family)